MIKQTFLFSLILSVFVTNFTAYAQEVVVDNVKIRLTKVKEVSKSFNVRSQNKTKSDDFRKILTRCKIIAIDKHPVDINSFSLLDTKNKIRYKIGDFLGYKGFSIMGSGVASKKYSSIEILDENGNQYSGLPEYDPSIKDKFYDYDFPGYTNFVVPINFGKPPTKFLKRKGEERITPIYYGVTDLNKFTAEIYFYVLTSTIKEPKLKLFYGKEFIAEIE